MRDPLAFHFGTLFFGLCGNSAFWLDAITRKAGVVTVGGLAAFAFVHETRTHHIFGWAGTCQEFHFLSFTGLLHIRRFVGGASKFVTKPASGVIATPCNYGIGIIGLPAKLQPENDSMATSTDA